MEVSLGVRKGSWTEEEDVVLRKCVEKYGEGRWHQVPARAGLNRCRKSCRLRWLNYLKPNIKRGEFQEDEIDLILRLHKLLGNRWSLIAGRLPGRTANDVKNYWNAHLKRGRHSNASSGAPPRRCPGGHKFKPPQGLVKVDVIKPRPRAFKNFSWKGTTGEAAVIGSAPVIGCTTAQQSDDRFGSTWAAAPPPAVDTQQLASLENDMSWLESLLCDNKVESDEAGGESRTTLTDSKSRGVVGSESDVVANYGDFWSLEMAAVAGDDEDQNTNGWNQELFNDMALSCWEFLGANDTLIIH